MSDDYRPIQQQPNITIVNKNINTQIARGKNPFGCGFAIAVGILAVIAGSALHNAAGGIIVVFGVMAAVAYAIYRQRHPVRQLPKSPLSVNHYHGNILHGHPGGDHPHDHSPPQG